jgi:hypothetical protein
LFLHSIGFGPLNGNYFHKHESYPNSVAFGRWMPGHFNPIETPESEAEVLELQGSTISPANGTHLGFRETVLPRGCKRLVSAFERCKMINGSEKCSTEIQNVMEQCPNWALESNS